MGAHGTSSDYKTGDRKRHHVPTKTSDVCLSDTISNCTAPADAEPEGRISRTNRGQAFPAHLERDTAARCHLSMDGSASRITDGRIVRTPWNRFWSVAYLYGG